MIEVVRAMEGLRRRIALSSERWRAVGNEIYDENNQYVGRAVTVTLAQDIADMHNIYLPITNIVVLLLKKHTDRADMRKEVANEGE